MSRPEGCIETYTGLWVNPLDLRSIDVEILDIAHALARQCRFNGHSTGHLSVARHSLWVALKLETYQAPPVRMLWGLLHDSAEAYLGDLVRPIKHSPFGEAYLAAEASAERAIAARFELPFPIPHAVHVADSAVLREELAEHRYTWDSSAKRDELDFLGLYEDLRKQVHVHV